MNSRRKFIQNTSLLGLAMSIKPDFRLLAAQDQILGHGELKYKVDIQWGNLDPTRVPVVNCHEMVMDRKGRMIMVTDEAKHNIITYDQSREPLNSWTLGHDRAHGWPLIDEGAAEQL